ncbi:MAG TPA: hypothetical protein ENO23_07750, partial [Alphaproteobacteria bacterium]|nr:hypothetical protein [Alphaproteobacteria bacterium]
MSADGARALRLCCILPGLMLLLGAIGAHPGYALAQAGAAEKPPAEYQIAGAFTGGTLTEGLVLEGIRFGTHSGFTRMVLDFEHDGGGGAADHPVYSVSYHQYPFRLVLR